MRKHLKRFRRVGVSLVELIVIMSAASVILSISAELIHRMMHAESKSRSFAAVERTSLRLANALRSDVHAASSAVTDQTQPTEGEFLRLEFPGGGRVEYRRENLTIHRLELDSRQIVAREQFLFASDFELRARSEGSRLILVTLTSRKEAGSADSEDPLRLANSNTVDLQVMAPLQGGGK